jgi:4-amino-4-deoxy-L-arabinose transferase-like glycosyltransferase
MASFLRSKTFFLTALLAVTLLSFAIRSYHIDSIPAGIYPDEAMNGTDAINANETGNHELFYPHNFGREGLFINLQAISIAMFGNTVPALKLWSGIFGALAVLGTGLLAWELFRSRSAALISAILMATSFWAINFSRIGFRAIMVPFLLAFIFFFFFRGLRTEKIRFFAFSGILFGLGLHTYVGFRVAPLILILLLPFLVLSYEGFFRKFWKHGLVFIATAFMAAAPMFHLFLTKPELFSSRSSAISVFSPEVNEGNLPGTLLKTLGLSLIKYNFVGDMNWRHNYPPYPVLDPIVGTFFLAGFIFSISMFARLFSRRLREKRRDIELPVHALLFIGFFTMLIPEFLTDEGLPHALRSIGTQPFVFLFATIPLFFIYKKIGKSKGGTKLAIISFMILALGCSATWNIMKYFVFFAENPKQHASFNAEYRNMADYLLSLPKETHKYVHPSSFVAAQPIRFLTHGKVENLEFLEESAIIKRPAVIILQRYDPQIFENIRKRIPETYELRIDLRPGYGSAFTAIILPE